MRKIISSKDMKRKREIMAKETEIKSFIQELSLLTKIINNDNNIDCSNSSSVDHAAVSEEQQRRVISYIPTSSFLSLCTLIVQVLDKIGPTMVVLKQDISKNIQRLEMLCDSDPATYSNLIEILNKEAVERNAKKSNSCSKALLWLTRSLDFMGSLLQHITIEPRENMEQIVGNSYEMTLKPWHGWISATAYKVALKLLPDTNTFISLLMAKGENFDTLRDEIQTLVSLLVPLLQQLHSTLDLYGLDRLKST
ncbi:glycolipid transfer protein 3-like [Chenopodium quinoa]|uniref:Glycolipid transfer protein domain-containing protein n=1 Tax=Chenopodium quinoa TaxID=63459 RepID=A0A803LHQ9_CHEQI|nr:glycolipid transfer protein 3-like [Chenopodium quinoa]